MRAMLVFFVSFLLQFLIIQAAQKFSFCIDFACTDKPQKLHVISISRAGGLGVVLSLAMSFIFARDNFLFFLPGIIVFLTGFYEDIRSEASPGLRLVLIAFGGAVGIALTGNVVEDIGFRLPYLFAVPFTIFALTGLTNAFNVIDGINGLASGIAMLALAFMAVLAQTHNDQVVFDAAVVIMVSIAGFFAWNFPNGRIFLGDGGAYLIGFLIAELSIRLVRTDSGVSPWFPVMLLAYPIFEVLFSIYRRVRKKMPAFSPDMFHLHTLICKRVAKSHWRTSLYLWCMAAAFDTAAFVFNQSTLAQVILFILFAFSYVCCYLWIVRFRRFKA